MPKLTINKDKCKGCLLCISVCARGALCVDKELNKRGVRPVKFKHGSDCAGCAMCAVICPDCCIEIWK